MDKEEIYVGALYLSTYMKEVMKKLAEDKKRPAVHTYNATLNSFTEFSMEAEARKRPEREVMKQPKEQKKSPDPDAGKQPEALMKQPEKKRKRLPESEKRISR